MGTINRGILGGFRKKTGTVVGACWRKLDVIRALPRKSGKAPTALQVEQQQKFRLVTTFLNRFKELIDAGFYDPGEVKTPMNLAVNYHLKEAVTGTVDHFVIDPAKVAFSRGYLARSLDQEVQIDPGSTTQLVVRWSMETEGDSSPDDRVSFLVYNKSQHRFIRVVNGATRADGTCSIQIPQAFSGEVYVYMNFSSRTYKAKKSDSILVSNLILN